MAHTPQVGMYEEQRQISDPVSDQRADVIDVAGVARLAVDAVVVIGPTTPGTTITGVADTAVPVGPAVALPAIPAGTTRMTYQNTVSGTVVRLREVGGAGGILLAYLGVITLGGEDGAIAAMEALHVSGPASAVATLFEGP